MSNSNNPLFLTYQVKQSKDKPYWFHVQMNKLENGKVSQSSDTRGVLMDTGSVGLVLSAKFFDDLKFTEIVPSPDKKIGYSSSGNYYKGSWVLVDEIIIKGQTKSKNYIRLKNFPVFRATALVKDGKEEDTKVEMMGVGFGSGINQSPQYNPFLNAYDHDSNPLAQAFEVTYEGIRFFTSEQAKSTNFTSFNRIDLIGTEHKAVQFKKNTKSSSKIKLWNLPMAQVIITNGKKTIYKDQLPFLLDTGITYMIITPSKDNPIHGNKKSHPKGFLPEGWNISVILETELGKSSSKQKLQVLDFSIPKEEAFNQYNKNPRKVRWGYSNGAGIVNTGRDLSFGYNYVINLQEGFVALQENNNKQPSSIGQKTIEHKKNK